MSMPAHIALIDCNNFFVSCERLFRPDLAHRPVIVLSSNDGCVISRSNEAKQLGFKMGEPYFMVRKQCAKNHVAVFSSNFALYRDLSKRIMHTLRRFSHNVEAYSVDEAFVALDSSKHTDDIVQKTACSIRDTLLREVGIPVSVGVAPTKTLAKVATHLTKEAQKKNPHEHTPETGTCILLDTGTTQRALEATPIDEVWGVGFRNAPKLRAVGIQSAAQLAVQPDRWVQQHLTIRGLRTVHELRGQQCFALGEEPAVRKSLLHSQSFGTPVRTYASLLAAVAHHARKVAEVLRAEGIVARDISVMVRASRETRQYAHATYALHTLPVHTNDTLTLVSAVQTILTQLYSERVSYKKAGVMVRDIMPEACMAARTLFGEQTPQHRALMQTLDNIRHTFGDVIHTAAEHTPPTWRARHHLLSPPYTTSWGAIHTIRST